jgi:hypothetical protein
MSETVQEVLDVPKEFFKDGTQFINRCTKRKWIPGQEQIPYGILENPESHTRAVPGAIPDSCDTSSALTSKWLCP